MNSMYKGVIFDLDGTIANTLPLCIEAFRRSIEPLTNRRLSDEEIIATFGPSEEGTIMALAPDFYQLGIDSYLKFYEELHPMAPEPFEGIKALITSLKSKCRIAMVTGKGVHSTRISLKAFGMADLFEVVETGSAKGPRKAAGIRAVLEHWNFSAGNDILYVGDAPGDISASREAGIPIAAVAWASTSDAQALAALHPDYLFNTVREFGSWLLQ